MKTALVVTTIGAPNEAMRRLAAGCRAHDIHMIVIGDRSSPPDFRLDGADYYDLERQRATGLATALACPERHYARKNIGYLLAMREGAECIIETDDDNLPLPAFWAPRTRGRRARRVARAGWVNVYRYFTQAAIWPRGLPLASVNAGVPDPEPDSELDCPIQQGLADDNPDVDAIYRLTRPLPVRFEQATPVALGDRAFCPFNSQNTTWFRDAFALMYLPALCSFRMTDIWRGFIAQRLAWARDWSVLFHAATVEQARNEHDLMRDFADEIPGYLHNAAIGAMLDELRLSGSAAGMGRNLRLAYEGMISNGWIESGERVLLDAWLEDLAVLGLA